MPPSLAVCHICGREFGRASIDIHVPQCARKWEAAEAQKPERERRPVPQRPELAPGTSQEQANELVRQQWNDKALEACPNCGRTFLPDRLEVHLRSCRPAPGAQPRAPASARGELRRANTTPDVGSASGRAPERPARRRASRPAVVACHICGREFGTASIDIHVPQCERKWQAAEASKPPAQRRPVPRRPELEPGMTLEQANDKVRQHWNDEVLQPCPHCGRTFLADRLEVHLRSCKPKSGLAATDGAYPSQSSKPASSSGARQRSATPTAARTQGAYPSQSSKPASSSGARQRSATPRAARPKVLVCHICGREFGTASIAIHVPQCERKWQAAEAAKPASQRRPVPRRPEMEPGLSAEEENERLQKHWNDKVLEACPHCGRTFLPERLEVHLRSCRPRSPSKPRASSCGAVGRGGGADVAEAQAQRGSGGERQPSPARRPFGAKPPPPVRPRMAVCHVCGREFGTASIAIHIPQCERKWEAAEAQKPPAQRRPVPQRPELEPGLSLDEANERLMQHWKDEVLEPCPHCGRTFLPDRLEVHLRSCRPKSPGRGQPPDGGAAGRAGQEDAARGAATEASKPSGSASETAGRRASTQGALRPRTVVCHICGREFGTASIDIHIPQCERKWEASEAKKPEGLRRPVPQRPDLGGLSRGEANAKLQQHWNDEVLEPCPHCGRTFLPDRLAVHLRSCRPREGCG